MGSITVPLNSYHWSVLEIKTKIVCCHIAYSKPVKQEVYGTVTLPPLVFPGFFYHSPYIFLSLSDCLSVCLSSSLSVCLSDSVSNQGNLTEEEGSIQTTSSY
jgi:hypothetical protein